MMSKGLHKAPPFRGAALASSSPQLHPLADPKRCRDAGRGGKPSKEDLTDKRKIQWTWNERWEADGYGSATPPFPLQRRVALYLSVPPLVKVTR